jgi:hypothetical protein
MQLFSKTTSAKPAVATAPATRVPLNFGSDPHGLKRLKKCRATTPAGMMRVASKILDEGTPQLISCKVEKGPRYVEQRCRTIDPNFRRAPFSRVRSPREARKRRAEGWTNCQFALPRLTLEGLRMIAIIFAQEQQHCERTKVARRYPKTRNYFVTAALNDYFRKMGFEQFCVEEEKPQANRVRRFIGPNA